MPIGLPVNFQTIQSTEHAVFTLPAAAAVVAIVVVVVDLVCKANDRMSV